jgi:hypothetical protein
LYNTPAGEGFWNYLTAAAAAAPVGLLLLLLLLLSRGHQLLMAHQQQPHHGLPTSLISLICWSHPPIMSYVESGTFSTFIRLTNGSILLGSRMCSA